MLDQGDPSLLFLGLVLPCLFALTLIAEGVWKISRRMSGWINVTVGVLVMVLSVWVYFGLLGWLSRL